MVVECRFVDSIISFNGWLSNCWSRLCHIMLVDSILVGVAYIILYWAKGGIPWGQLVSHAAVCCLLSVHRGSSQLTLAGGGRLPGCLRRRGRLL